MSEIFKENGGATSDACFSPTRFGLFLGLALVCVFPKVALGLHTFFYRDFGVLAYPVVFYHHESFWRGELPLWNPLSNCGAPFLAQWGTMVLYPFSLFYLLLPLPWSLNVFCLAHLFWAGLGMYFLAWRWTGHRFAASVAGTAFVFNGVTFSCLIWPNYTVALGWMPWVVLWVERAWREGGRTLIVAALIATMQMLAGVPEIVLLTWLLLSGGWINGLFQREIPIRLHFGRPAAIVLLVSGLCAAQLLPFFDLLAQSQRGPEFATAKWSMPAWGWGHLILPLFRCFLTPQGIFFQIGQEFMSSTYLGVSSLLLGIYAVCAVRDRRVGLLAALGIFSLLMALGENGSLYRWIKEAAPLLGFARYPIKFVVLATFAFTLLSAYAVRVLDSAPRLRAEPRWRSLFLIAAGMLLAIGLLIEFTRQFPTNYDQWAAILRCGMGRVLFLVGSVILLCALGSTRKSSSRLATQYGLLLVVIFDVATHVPNQNPTLPAYALAPDLFELHNKIPPPKHGQGRVLISPSAEQHLLLSRVPDWHSDLLGKRLALWSNLNLLEGAPKVNGSSTLQVREQMEVQSLLYASTNADWPSLADFLSVSLSTAPGQIVEWAPRQTFLPLITGGQRPIFADAAETLRGLTNAAFKPHQEVYLPNEARSFVTATNQTEVRIASSKIKSRKIEVEISASQRSLVVVAQTHYPAWHAYVDGHSTRVWRANHAFQALEVPSGIHRVALVYEDRWLKFGAAISLATLLVCGAGWFRERSTPSPAQL